MQCRVLPLWMCLLVGCPPSPASAPDEDPDRDGWSGATDCAPDDPLANPAAPELCDGQDDDCDGAIDEDAVDGVPYAADLDGDGWGAGPTVRLCAPTPGWGLPGDCDDTTAQAHPGAAELCDGLDNNCDGRTDEPDNAPVWAPDTDGDGHGDPSRAQAACEAPEGWVAGLGDCDDTDPEVSPDGVERCGGSDEDCDGAVDEGAVDAPNWSPDTDGDGWGAGELLAACEAPPGYAAPGDCDDSDAALAPGATELCDGLDNNCDGLTDDPSAEDAPLWAPDRDGDGHGDTAWAAPACEGPAGFVTDPADCDDTDPSVSPDAAEVCGDGLDNNCDGLGGAGCGPVGELSLGDASATRLGQDAGDALGAVLAAGLDVSGDGVPDLLLGTPSHSHSARNDGAAWLLLGPLSGSSDLSSAEAVLVGEGRGDGAGGAVALVPDVDGDGRAELAIGASTEDTGGSDAGAVVVVLGGISGTRDLSAAYARCWGEAASDWAGEALAAGDLDGDGLPDLAVGATGSDRGGDGAGAVYLLWGVPAGDTALEDADAILVGEAAGDRAGAALAAAGDLDGDGSEDLLVGAWGHDGGGGNSGAAYVLLGLSPGVQSLGDAALRLEGEASNDYAGAAVSGAGDLDGDGYGDWLVSARSQDAAAEDAGAVYVFLGPPAAQTLGTADAMLLGEAAFDYAGYALAAPGDTDGDGRDDVLVGAHYADGDHTDSGAAYLVLGPVSGAVSLADAAAVLRGAKADDRAGSGLGGAGDQDGDGLPDLLIGSPGQDDAGSEAGAVALVLGGPGL